MWSGRWNRLIGRDLVSGIDISSNLRIVQACLDNRQWNLSLFEEFCRNLKKGGAMSRILRELPSGNHSLTAKGSQGLFHQIFRAWRYWPSNIEWIIGLGITSQDNLLKLKKNPNKPTYGRFTSQNLSGWHQKIELWTQGATNLPEFLKSGPQLSPRVSFKIGQFFVG